MYKNYSFSTFSNLLHIAICSHSWWFFSFLCCYNIIFIFDLLVWVYPNPLLGYLSQWCINFITIILQKTAIYFNDLLIFSLFSKYFFLPTKFKFTLLVLGFFLGLWNVLLSHLLDTFLIFLDIGTNCHEISP